MGGDECGRRAAHRRPWIERLSGCPREHLEFHLWYLKAKGWIAKLENGTVAITVDRANSERGREPVTKLLTSPKPAG